MTNQFTDEQEEAAVNAAWAEAMKHRGVGGQVVQAPTFEFIQVVHAALEAAAGVAPQAPSEERAKLIGRLTGSVNPLGVTCGECGSKPGKRCYGGGEMYRPHPSREGKAERELMLEAADALAAPVQPSSTVDEAAITEVINQTIEAMPHARRLYPDVYASEVGRAVVEAIGGESRAHD